jgi:hypothetical protein
MKGLSTRQVLGRSSALLFSAAVLTGGATAAVIAPLPGAVWSVVADDEGSSSHGHSGGQPSDNENSHKSGQGNHQQKPAAKPPAANPDNPPAQGQANQPAPPANGAAPGNTSNAPGPVAGGSADPPVSQVQGASTNQPADPKPADPKPSTQSKPAIDDLLGASIGSLPGQLIDHGGSPIGASKDSGIADLLMSLVWACVSGLLVVLVRRRIGRQRKDPDYVPMTLGTYDFRE